MQLSKYIFLVIFITLSSRSAAQVAYSYYSSEDEKLWVEKQLSAMTQRDKIAQLFMIAVYSNRDAAHENDIDKLVSQGIGGVVFFQGTTLRTAQLANRFQNTARTPLFVAIDGEWGPAMRLTDGVRFPYLMTLGAIQSDSLLWYAGYEMGRQFMRMGVNMNLAPVADVNNNPLNPVINFRSLGSDANRVAQQVRWINDGMKSSGIMTCAKHFPGHGDTETDSHFDLPVVPYGFNRLDSIELKPFKGLINSGVDAVMVAHLNMPALQANSIPSTFSDSIINGILVRKLNFDGLVMTDALNMKGVTNDYKPGEIELKALLAGNDILLYSADPVFSINYLEKALQNGEISIDLIEKKCKRILRAKYRNGIRTKIETETENLYSDLNNVSTQALIRNLFESSIVLLQQTNAVPLLKTFTYSIASVAIGADSLSAFQKMSGNYANIQNIIIKDLSDKNIDSLLRSLKKFRKVIVSVHGIQVYPKQNYGVSAQTVKLIEKISKQNETILVWPGNPYALNGINLSSVRAILIGWQRGEMVEQILAQSLFGAIEIKGKLSLNLNIGFKLGFGIHSKGGHQLRYAIGEQVDVNSSKLKHAIDSIAILGLNEKAYPGCQVMVVRKGAIIFHQTYGSMFDDSMVVVTPNALYDLASITKVVATLPALMMLYEADDFDFDDKISKYYRKWRRSNKQDITFREALAHQARLTPWIPFYKEFINEDKTFNSKYITRQHSYKTISEISPGLYITRKADKKIFSMIRDSELLEKTEYKYSDLSFYVYPKIIEKLTFRHFDTYLKETLYIPLGAHTFTYNAWHYFNSDRIVPTERDTFFRNTLLRGFVHDEGAALLGGISGHAGLFGTATDLAKYMQMILNKGEFAGTRFYSEATVDSFLVTPFLAYGNRRALGWDKPLINNNILPLSKAYPAPMASAASFGHGGFTGTFIWADPDNELIFIFLSNRVSPYRSNQKLYDLNIRPAMHQACYDALIRH